MESRRAPATGTDGLYFLTALHSQYGGAKGCLKSIGVSAQEIQQLKLRLGQAG